MSNRTALFTHPASHGHDTPDGHPERIARIEAVEQALAPLTLDRRTCPSATRDDLLRVHPAAYLDRLDAIKPKGPPVPLDPDTWMTMGMMEAALHAAGGNVAAVDAVMAGDVQTAFVATRPPGHHAEADSPMGFCIFGNVALAAKHALDHHRLSRVAIVDFDVHHGNGTQDLLWQEERVLFISSHQMPLYPGTGAAHETGAHGQITNLPLPPGAGSAAFRKLYRDKVFPALVAYAPDLLLISAGFDAHADDPLAQLDLTTEDFGWVTAELARVSAPSTQGRIVSTLEGGYDLNALAASTVAHVHALQQEIAT